MAITENSNIGQILKDYPQAIEVFARNGFERLKDPSVQAMAGQATISMAASYLGISRDKIEALVKELETLES